MKDFDKLCGDDERLMAKNSINPVQFTVWCLLIVTIVIIAMVEDYKRTERKSRFEEAAKQESAMMASIADSMKAEAKKATYHEDECKVIAWNWVNMNKCNAGKNYQGQSGSFHKTDSGYTYTASWKVGAKRIRYYFYFDEHHRLLDTRYSSEGYIN